jgi:CheY-like chemotaxis protein
MSVARFILVVEDDPEDQELLADIFRRTGVSLFAKFVSSSTDAIQHLQACAHGESDWPHFVLLDLGLGQESGFSVLQWLREGNHLSSTAVVVISGSIDPEDVQAARAQGARAYLPKMPHPAVLAHILSAPVVQSEMAVRSRASSGGGEPRNQP